MKRVLIAILFLMLVLPGTVFCEWDKAIPITTDDWVDFPADQNSNNLALDGLLSQYPKGITLSFSSATTIVASTGGVVCSNSAGTIRKFRNNTAETNITFANLDIGTEDDDTYYVYASCDAVATTAVFKISLSSTEPDGVTSYKRIGSFINLSDDITEVTNDSVRMITSTGSISHGVTISLPDGYEEEECDWTVSGYQIRGYGVDAAGSADDYYKTYASDARVVTCQTTNTGAGTANGTCNFLIICNR